MEHIIEEVNRLLTVLAEKEKMKILTRGTQTTIVQLGHTALFVQFTVVKNMMVSEGGGL